MMLKKASLVSAFAITLALGNLLAYSGPVSALAIKETIWARLDEAGAMIACDGKFRRGEKVHLVLRSVGPFKAGVDGRHWFDMDMLVVAPDGHIVLNKKNLLGENGHVKLEAAIAESPYGIFESAISMEPGEYRMTLIIRDQIAGTQAGAVRSFTLEPGLAYGDTAFARMDDQNKLIPVEKAAFRRGEPVHLLLINVGLFKKGTDGKHFFDIDLEVKNPSGKSVYAQENMLGEKGHIFLANDVAGSPYVTFYSTQDMPAGTYTMRMTVHDRIGNENVAVKRAFELLAETKEKEKNKENDKEAVSFGTGFLISEDGYILTAAHVVKDAGKISVDINGTLKEAQLITIDTINDVAVLKTTGFFSPASIGNANESRLGDTVFTVGFPNIDIQGVSPKLTEGVISSLNGIKDDPRSFQISTPVQPGNSGGPLVLKNGNVIGIVRSTLSPSAAFSSTGRFPQNVNYAVKINYAVVLLDSLGIKIKTPSNSSKEDPIDRIVHAVVLIKCQKDGGS